MFFDLVRDQGVGGSNPLSPDQSFQILIGVIDRTPGMSPGARSRNLHEHWVFVNELTATATFSSTPPRQADIQCRQMGLSASGLRRSSRSTGQRDRITARTYLTSWLSTDRRNDPA